ncbi:MAG: DUF1552 domain-containing protein [Pirellulaceae bacterium]|nr:DUF1552 domain-containing protein [Pirellulaceae bacterium]
MSKQISRRTVLRGAGAVLALPLLEAMSPNIGWALSKKAGGLGELPQRTAFFYVPNGMHMPDWTPSSTGSQFRLPATLKPLESFKSRMNVLSGLTLDGARAHGDGPGDHARSVAAFLTGAHPKKTDGAGIHNGPSVDQVLANHVGRGTKLASLEIGMEGSAPAGRCDSGYSCVYTSNISWRTATTPVAKEINPGALFDRLFGTRDEQATKIASEKRRKYRQSILDFVRHDAKKMHHALGTDDRRKLDEYLFAVRDVEKRIAGVEKLDRVETEVPDYPRPEGVPRDYAEHMKLLYDVMVLAFQTDSTRVMSFMFANAGSNRSYRTIGVKSGHHHLSHHGNNKEKQAQISKINEYHMQLFAYFLERLQATQEGQGSLLDQCTILYGSGIADGNRHAHDTLPIMTIGDNGGHFRTGRHIRFEKETPLTNLYLTMLQNAGTPVKSIGDSNAILKELGEA